MPNWNNAELVGAGHLILHRFCGDEIYAITEAKILAFERPRGARVWFDAASDKCVQTLPDTEELYATPKVEIRVDLPALVPNRLVGRTYRPTNREPNGDPPGFLDYMDRQEVAEPVVEVLARDGNVFVVRVSGVTTDVNYFDASKPDTRVELVGRFTFEDADEWESG